MARLETPVAVAVGPEGNICIADRTTNAIRAVTTSGQFTTVAGLGDQCDPQVTPACGDGGPAVQAALANPTGVAVAANGDVYIADQSNHRVRRVAANGFITTIAGGTGAGFSGDGGPAAAAQLNNPTALTVGPDHSVYVSDFSNGRVRRIASDWIISTVAGGGGLPAGGQGITPNVVVSCEIGGDNLPATARDAVRAERAWVVVIFAWRRETMSSPAPCRGRWSDR